MKHALFYKHPGTGVAYLLATVQDIMDAGILNKMSPLSYLSSMTQTGQPVVFLDETLDGSHLLDAYAWDCELIDVDMLGHPEQIDDMFERATTFTPIDAIHKQVGYAKTYRKRYSMSKRSPRQRRRILRELAEESARCKGI